MPLFETDDGVSLSYEEEGGGPPLVFVHGWAMSGRVWRFQAQAFAPGRRVVMPDLRGHGRSGAGGECTLERLGDDLAGLFAGLDLRDGVVVGWSLGAQVVLRAFPRLRERLRGVVLVGATPRFTETEGYPHGLPAAEARGMGVRLKRDFNRTMGEFFRSMFAPGELDRSQENAIAREIVMGGRLPEPAAARHALDILSAADLRELLPRVDLPVLLLHGDADTICPPGAARFMAGQLPRATLRLFEGCGHAPFLSRPGEFNHILARFIDGLSP
jgi:pimeloyl-[acyl-carrier protein] methyl ester esterase